LLERLGFRPASPEATARERLDPDELLMQRDATSAANKQP
jgi:hypothetical protein